MNYKDHSAKRVGGKIAFTIISACCFLLILFPQSCKNGQSSAAANSSPDASTDPCAAAKKLARKGQESAIEPLIHLIIHQKEMRVIKCEAEALAAIDSDKSVHMLAKALKDSDLAAASRAALALGMMNNKGATHYLMKAFFESGIPCPAAIALGMIKDPRVLPSLIKAMHNHDSSIRGCAIQAVALYHDPRVCKTLADIFMTDNDQGVQFMARAARDAIPCPSGDKGVAKYSLAGSYCKLGQRLIDAATPLLNNTTGLKEWQSNEWQKSREWKDAVAEILQGYDRPAPRGSDAEKDLKLKFTLTTLITEWGDNVFHHRLIPKTDQLMRATAESAVKDKMARLHLLCPNLKFPDVRH